MQYSSEIEINLPVDKVIALFDNPENLKKWMKNLERFEHISGTPGQPGAKSRLVFRNGKREVELIETITVRNLPEEFSGTYEMKGVYNKVKNKFIAEGNKTRYISEVEFRFSGLFMKIMGGLFPGAFKKESEKHLKAFKEFAEKN
jgi:uncharacterized membrane protein